MPHITIEYSTNLEQRLDLAEFCDVVLQAAISTGVLELAATRVRAIGCEYFAIADRHPENGFIDVALRMGRGRSQESKAATGQAIWRAMRAHCAPLYKSHFFALSLELREIDPDMSWKENGIKPRLRKTS